MAWRGGASLSIHTQSVLYKLITRIYLSGSVRNVSGVGTVQTPNAVEPFPSRQETPSLDITPPPHRPTLKCQRQHEVNVYQYCTDTVFIAAVYFIGVVPYSLSQGHRLRLIVCPDGFIFVTGYYHTVGSLLYATHSTVDLQIQYTE